MKDLSKIRNFCIIAHIDHGKSTLADRLIEYTGTMEKRDIKDRVMDTLELEQERGITIKLQTARLEYKYLGTGHDQVTGERIQETENTSYLSPDTYILNLIDTPGHVDFSYEVSRSVAASEGALLIVDATQGIQAQTLSTIYKAMEYDLTIIPVLNKVDLPNAEIDRVKQEIIDTFGFSDEEIILASGKTGIGTMDILDAIVERVPPPDRKDKMIYLNIPDDEDDHPHLLIFDAFYHEYKGVVALVKAISGRITESDELYMIGSKTKIHPIEIGYLKPKMFPQSEIEEGEVGYIATGLKDIQKVHTGDTITKALADGTHKTLTPLMGYQKPLPMVFASLYPVEANDFEVFRDALEKLAINDAALSYQKEYSQALGTGFVCGFLGLLHLEITQDRLEREFGINLISTTPTVEFRVHLTTQDYSKVPYINTSNIDPETNIARIRTAAEFPDGSLYDKVLEPWVKLEILTPEQYIGEVMELAQKNRGLYKTMHFITKADAEKKHAMLIYEIPTVEIIINFFDKLKSVTHGYASMDYSFIDFRPGEITKVTILVNEEEVEPLSFLAHKDMAARRGKDLVAKLKDIIPRQQFKVPIQAALGASTNIIARETIQAFRKDVTAKLYGGDESRKKKLLEKQKKGKKKLKTFGKVEIPKEAFLSALKID